MRLARAWWPGVVGRSGWSNLADIHGTTSTIENGTLTVGLFDPANEAACVARLRVQDARY